MDPKPATNMSEQERFEEIRTHENHSVQLHTFGSLREKENPMSGEMSREWFPVAVQLICEDCDEVLHNFYNREAL